MRVFEACDVAVARRELSLAVVLLCLVLRLHRLFLLTQDIARLVDDRSTRVGDHSRDALSRSAWVRLRGREREQVAGRREVSEKETQNQLRETLGASQALLLLC